MNITAQEIINTMFNPTDKVCLRVFDDWKPSTYKGQKLDVEAGKFSSIEETLRKHNALHRGIFYVVNYGGQNDDDITRVNAQFVEMDDKSFDEQMALIEAFPLKPSFIIKTRKSLHTYWLMDKDAKVSRFRRIQEGLIAHFGGDPDIKNESRVMRLPGFYHAKEEPVMVECIAFHPELRYTQLQLAEVLGIKNLDEEEERKIPEGKTKGLKLAEAGCLFLQHCRTDAATLSEHDWYAMVTNLAVFEGGKERIHELSKSYPKYSKEETDDKISHFLKSGTRPMTCSVIAEKGFHCPLLGTDRCRAKAPAARCGVPLDVETLISMVKAIPSSNDFVSDLQTARKFIEDYMFNADPVTAQTVIKYEMAEHFNLRKDDTKPLITHQKDLARKASSSVAAGSLGELPPWYELSKMGVTFKPGILAEHLAKEEKVIYAAEEFLRYQNGVYSHLSDLDAQNIVREKMLPEATKLSQITDATGQWRMQISRPIRDLNANPYMINVRNGVYSVLDGKLLEHDASYLSTVQINASYTPGAECPRFRSYLEELLPSDQIPLVQEMLGYLLVPVNRAQKSFVILGEAGAGKSVLLRLIGTLLGEENVSNVSWQALNERFKTAELYGKLANIFADLPTRNIDDNGIFKALVGDDYLTVEKKNRDPFSFVSFARLVFSCNKIPTNYGDKSEGFYRRLVIIKVGHAVAPEKKDPQLLDKLIGEIDGIFLFALEGLRRLMENRWRLSETESNKAELQRYREDSNSVLSFLRDCGAEDPESEVSTMEAYGIYKTYCEDSGLKPCSQKTFTHEVLEGFPGVIHGKDSLRRKRVFKGLRLEDEDA